MKKAYIFVKQTTQNKLSDENNYKKRLILKYKITFTHLTEITYSHRIP